MSHQPSDASAECIIFINDAGMDRFHTFLDQTWAELRQQVSVKPEAEVAITLMLGEIIANAARHAYADVPESERLLRIRLEATSRCIRGEVWDHGHEFPGAEERLREAATESDDASSESGRGLRILTQLADCVRYERTASGENAWFIGKCEAPNQGAG
jgi:anti-sigma regulatory factor (Ser/Thr protein kinase)